MVTIHTTKTELLDVLDFIKSSMKVRTNRAKETMCELTVTDNKLTIAAPGNSRVINCQTKGVANHLSGKRDLYRG